MYKVKTYLVLVEGSGRFPIDMLRRDHAYPYREKDSVEIACPTFGTPRQVAVVMPQPPTHERWLSFGWQVLDCKEL